MAIALLISASALAQAVTRDSITSLKQQKEALKVGKDLNEKKLKLADLQNSVEKKTLEMQNASQKAQIAAADNNQAANNLNTNVQDAKLASEASKKANTAKSDAKKARNANKDLVNLNKKIDKLKKQIADDETKLAAMPGATVPPPIPVVTTPVTQ